MYKFTITIILKNGHNEILNTNIEGIENLKQLNEAMDSNLKKETFSFELEDRIMKFISSEISYIRMVKNF